MLVLVGQFTPTGSALAFELQRYSIMLSQSKDILCRHHEPKESLRDSLPTVTIKRRVSYTHESKSNVSASSGLKKLSLPGYVYPHCAYFRLEDILY